MADYDKRKRSIYLTPHLSEALGAMPKGVSLTGRLTALADRYTEILGRTGVKQRFTADEWTILRGLLARGAHEPAAMIRGLHVGVGDVIHHEAIVAGWSAETVDALMSKLRDLSYAEEVAVIEEVEQFERAAEAHIPTPGKRAAAWWRSMTPRDFAAFRRGKIPNDVFTQRAAWDLVMQLGVDPKNDADVDVVFGLAIVLSLVEADSNIPVAIAASASPNENEIPVVAEARVRQLHAQIDVPGRIRGFQDLVRALGGEVHVADLADYFLGWHDVDVQRRFAKGYY